MSNLNEEDTVRPGRRPNGGEPRAMKTYEASLKDKRDWKNALDTTLEEGREKRMKEGMKKRNLEIAKNLKQAGVNIEIISQTTGGCTTLLHAEYAKQNRKDRRELLSALCGFPWRTLREI